MDELGVEGKYLESQQQTDYEKNINAFIEEGCDLIVTVGFLLGDATAAGAEANPDQKFTIVDFAYDPTLPNVVGQVFNTQEAAFLAGYLPPASTKTGKIGTFGGIQIPPVTVFMDGFALGVAYYNERARHDVEVLGWDPAAQTGLFTGNFESLEDGRNLGNVADGRRRRHHHARGRPGWAGHSRCRCKSAARSTSLVWTHDWVLHQLAVRAITLTSVLKNMDVTTMNVIAVRDRRHLSQVGVTVGTLENGGVGLAPFHSMD